MSGSKNILSYFGKEKETFSLCDIKLWKKEKCSEMKETILPRLIAIFDNEHCMSKRIDVFHTIVEKFLPCLSLDEIIKHIEPLLLEMFNIIECCFQYWKRIKQFTVDICNNERHNQCSLLGDGMTEILSENLKVISLLLKTATAISVYCGHIPLFFSWGLHALRKGDEFCESSKEISCTSNLQASLEQIFIVNKNLQEVIVNQLHEDKLRLDIITSPKYLLILCSSIQYSYREVKFCNLKFHALLWKFYANLIIRYEVLKQDFNISKDCQLRYLCSYTLTLIKNLRQHVEVVNTGRIPIMENFDHNIHMTCFHLKIVTFIYKKFQTFEEECVTDLYNMLQEFYYLLLELQAMQMAGNHIFLFRYIPTYSFTAHAGIRQNVTHVVEALMQYLVCEKKIMSLLLQPIVEDLKPEIKIAFWFVKLSAVQLQPHCTDNAPFLNNGEFCSCTNSFIIIRSILKDLYTCDTGLLSVYLTVVSLKDSKSRDITLYEYIYMIFCNFASRCCPGHFNDLEKHMLKILLGKANNVTCLICDIWYFFCRCGPHELILKYCYLFERLFQKVSYCTLIWIKCIVKRLLKLAPEKIKWQLGINCPILISEISTEDPFDIMSHPDHLFYLIRHIKDTRLSSFITSLRILKTMDQIICSKQNAEALTQGLQIQIITCLLDLSACIVFFSKTDQKILLQILHFAGFMWNSACDAVQLNILFLLQAWGHIVIPPSPYQNKILHCLGKLFNLALDHENSIMQHQALCVFYEFSYSTPHTLVVQECLRACNKPVVKNFLTKVQSNIVLNRKDLIDSLLHQGQWLRRKNNIHSQKNVDFDIFHIVDCHQAVDKGKMQELQLNLKIMKDTARKLASFQKLPSWALKSIRNTCQFIDKNND